MKIKISSLEKLIKTAFLKKFDKADAEMIKDVLLFGEPSGKTSPGSQPVKRSRNAFFTY